MPDKGAPQLEDGYTRIANEILEALCKTKFTNAESRLITAILRLTYGVYGRKSAKIETGELMALTELPSWHIGKARSKLIKRNVISVSLGANQQVKTYRFNKYYKKWKPLAQEPNRDRQAKPVGPGATPVGPGVNRTFIKENKKESIKESKGAEKKPAPAPPPYERIIEFLNAMTGSKFDHTAKETRAAIRARFKSGYTEQDIKDVITIKTDQWLGDPKMIAYLRPGTLFRPTKFEGYLQEARRSKKLVTSEKQRIKERKFTIAAGILRDSGQQAALTYCLDNNIDAEEFKQWKLKNIDS